MSTKPPLIYIRTDKYILDIVMKLLLVISAYFFLETAQASSLITSVDRDKIIELIQTKIIEKEPVKNTGIAISVFTKDETIVSMGFGLKNRKSNETVNDHTLFAIGSTTKAFTSLALKQLENKGLLKLSDPVKLHYPEFDLKNSTIAKRVTIEDLLSHQVGLPRHDLMWLLTPFSREENLARLPFLDFPENVDENSPKSFRYNNFMYTVAGKLVELKSNESYENYIQKNILNKLFMRETTLSVPLDLTNVATPYYQETELPHNNIQDMAPAGSIYSNAHDMRLWIQSHLNGSHEGLNDLLNPRISLTDNPQDLTYAYGLGWMTNTTNPKAALYFHNGSIDGFSAMVLFSPELNLGIVALVNQQGSDLHNEVIVEILKYVLGKQKTNSLKNFRRIKLPLIKQDLISSLSSTHSVSTTTTIVTYSHLGYGDISLEEINGEFFARYYSHSWKLKDFENDYYNYIFDFPLMGQNFEFPLKITSKYLIAPFESDAPVVQFEVIK